MSSACEHCDGLGGKKTYANQVCMPLNGRVQCIDHCIHQIVAALNAGGVVTMGSCCGHGEMPGNILLQDGRMLAIFASREDARMCDRNANNDSIRSPDRSQGVWRPPRLHDMTETNQDISDLKC